MLQVYAIHVTESPVSQSRVFWRIIFSPPECQTQSASPGHYGWEKQEYDDHHSRKVLLPSDFL